MTLSQARKRVEDAGGNWEVFCKWMVGQTTGIDSETGEPDIYKYDVERFIRYQCDPSKEPWYEVD